MGRIVEKFRAAPVRSNLQLPRGAFDRALISLAFFRGAVFANLNAGKGNGPHPRMGCPELGVEPGTTECLAAILALA